MCQLCHPYLPRAMRIAAHLRFPATNGIKSEEVYGYARKIVSFAHAPPSALNRK